MSDKARRFIIEGGNVCFIADISGTITRDDCCARVAIEWNMHNFSSAGL